MDTFQCHLRPNTITGDTLNNILLTGHSNPQWLIQNFPILEFPPKDFL